MFRRRPTEPIDRDDVNLILVGLMRLDGKLEDVLRLLKDADGEEEENS